MRHLISDIESKAKKEIRKKGGLASAERIYLKGGDDYRLYALRIFLSALFLKRTDIVFVTSEDEATTVFSSETLDDAACGLLDAVLEGRTAYYLESKEKRVIAPLSVIPADEVYLYAKEHGWKGDGIITSSTKEFLDEFSKGRRGTKYALKNTADFLEDIS
ncbi:MAG TPA: hypothetical protein O0W83_01575 [Methanocorpusculum sp.]|nr:hypothetical protein [Methanocorpusculum sp.]